MRSTSCAAFANRGILLTCSRAFWRLAMPVGSFAMAAMFMAAWGIEESRWSRKGCSLGGESLRGGSANDQDQLGLFGAVGESLRGIEGEGVQWRERQGVGSRSCRFGINRGLGCPVMEGRARCPVPSATGRDTAGRPVASPLWRQAPVGGYSGEVHGPRAIRHGRVHCAMCSVRDSVSLASHAPSMPVWSGLLLLLHSPFPFPFPFSIGIFNTCMQVPDIEHSCHQRALENSPSPCTPNVRT